MLRLSNIRHWPTERISQRVLYLLITLAAVVFVLFYGIGYDRPFADNPSFNAPLFTDLLLSLMLVLILLAGGLSIWAVGIACIRSFDMGCCAKCTQIAWLG